MHQGIKTIGDPSFYMSQPTVTTFKLGAMSGISRGVFETVIPDDRGQRLPEFLEPEQGQVGGSLLSGRDERSSPGQHLVQEQSDGSGPAELTSKNCCWF